jgi:prepilin-type N-terminal cleavage/methylation domain-containing protein
MQRLKDKQKAKGFTIIEVLIVLAIAGLILLVVFLAVPALQRNARNTQRNADISGMLAAVNEFVNNNNGLVPNSIATANGIATITNTAITGVNNVTAKVGYYRNGGVSWVTTAPGTAGVNNTNVDTVVFYGGGTLNGGDCNALGTMAVNGSTRSVAATYMLEASALQCKSL